MRSGALAIVFALLCAPCHAGKRDDQVNKDRADLEDGEVWIYNDLEKAYAEGRPVKDVAREMTDLSDEELDRLLDPAALTQGGIQH